MYVCVCWLSGGARAAKQWRGLYCVFLFISSSVNTAAALFVSFRVISKVLLHRLTRECGGEVHYLPSGVCQSSPSQVNRSQQETRTHRRVKQQASAAALHLHRGGEGEKIHPAKMAPHRPNSCVLLPSSGSCVHSHR